MLGVSLVSKRIWENLIVRYRPLGMTGIRVSELSFGAGPVSGLMTGDSQESQKQVVERAITAGINWFDTAASYGAGRSEDSLGLALSSIRTDQQLHVATKVRLLLDGERDLRPMVTKSLGESLRRLRLPRVTVLQIHNSITRCRGDEPTSITADDVLGPHGILAAMEDLRADGLVDHFGLTGIGDADCLEILIKSRRFATIQAPFHLLNPSTLLDVSSKFSEKKYGGFLRAAESAQMGNFAIRVFAAGALLNLPPSSHTQKTPFFPLSLYERDRALAAKLGRTMAKTSSLHELALRYVTSHREITSAIVGFGAVEHVDDAVRICELGPLSIEQIASINYLTVVADR